DQIVGGLGAAGRQDRREVVTQRGRGGKAAFRIQDPAQQRDGPALKLRVVLLRQAQQPGDDLAGIVEGEFLDQVGLPVGRELVDQAVAYSPDQLVFPSCQRLLREGL